MTTVLVRIGDEVLGLRESLNDATLGDLFTLKIQSRAFGEACSVKTIAAAFDHIDRIGDDYRSRLAEWEADKDTHPEGEPKSATLTLLDDESIIINLIALLYLAKRKSESPITFAEATSISFTGFSLEFEDDEDEEDGGDADPKELTPMTSPGVETSAPM